MKTNAMLNNINKDVVAIIPARSGSKGIKNKNIKSVAGFPLMAYSVIAAKLSKEISRVIISTNSIEYAEIAKIYGAEAPFLRPENISGDKSTDLDFMNHAIEWLYNNEGSIPAYFVHLRPTCPLRDYKVIDDAIKLIKKHPEATCLLSATKAREILTPYKWLKKENDIYYKSIFFADNDEANLPRQSYPDTYIPSTYVDILSSKSIIENGKLRGNKILAYETPYTIDIDEISDFNKVLKYITNNEFDLYKYLKDKFPVYYKEW